jgi:hypothetical protein
MEIDVSNNTLSFLLATIPMLMLALLSSHLSRFGEQVKRITTEMDRLSGILQSLHNDSAMQSQYTAQLFERVNEARKSTERVLSIARAIDQKLGDHHGN